MNTNDEVTTNDIETQCCRAGKVTAYTYRHNVRCIHFHTGLPEMYVCAKISRACQWSPQVLFRCPAQIEF